MNKLIKIVSLVILMFVNYSCTRTETIEEYEDGKVKIECEIRNGKRDGKCIGYYSSGEREFVSNYEDDTLNGTSKFFHKNGQLHWEVSFENGQKSGEVQYFDSLGRIFQQSSFKNNKLDGKSLSFYSNGNIKEEMNYKNGLLDGVFKSYYEDGNLKTKAKYAKDVLLGFTTYDSLGKILDHDIKYEIEDNHKDSVVELSITVLNKVFDALGLEVSAKMENGELNPIETIYTQNNKLKLVKRLDNDLQDTLYLKLFEVEKLEGKGEGVIRSIEHFKYPPPRWRGSVNRTVSTGFLK